jgi:hypothetical protein
MQFHMQRVQCAEAIRCSENKLNALNTRLVPAVSGADYGAKRGQARPSPE